MRQAVLPCLCCGKPFGNMQKADGISVWRVTCTSCHASGPGISFLMPGDPQAQAVDAWNAWAVGRKVLEEGRYIPA